MPAKALRVFQVEAQTAITAASRQAGVEITSQPHTLYACLPLVRGLLASCSWPFGKKAMPRRGQGGWTGAGFGGCSFGSSMAPAPLCSNRNERGWIPECNLVGGECRVCCWRLLIIWRSISLFLIKYKDYLTVIISTRWLRIKGAASKACLGEAKARFASFIINHQESLFS